MERSTIIGISLIGIVSAVTGFLVAGCQGEAQQNTVKKDYVYLTTGMSGVVLFDYYKGNIHYIISNAGGIRNYTQDSLDYITTKEFVDENK